MIRIKRVYDPPAPGDGRRILVDRLWPRGLSKRAARVDEWMRDIAPSDALRRWYGHDPDRFLEFRDRYRDELVHQAAKVSALAVRSEREPVTLLYAARDGPSSNAAVLRELLEESLA